MDKNYYYTGTDYGSMHPFHYEFWYHLFVPWDALNWIWLVLSLLVFWVRFNDALISNRIEK